MRKLINIKKQVNQKLFNSQLKILKADTETITGYNSFLLSVTSDWSWTAHSHSESPSYDSPKKRNSHAI